MSESSLLRKITLQYQQFQAQYHASLEERMEQTMVVCQKSNKQDANGYAQCMVDNTKEMEDLVTSVQLRDSFRNHMFRGCLKLLPKGVEPTEDNADFKACYDKVLAVQKSILRLCKFDG
jgi:hypothetical protein